MLDATQVNDLIALCLANDDQFIGVEESERNFMKQLLTNLYALQEQNTQILHSPAAPPADVLNPQPTGNFSGTKIYNLESEIAHQSIYTDIMIVRKAQSNPTPSPPDQLTPTQNSLEPSDPIANHEEGVPMPPNHSLNPGEKGFNLPDLTLNPGEKGLYLPDPSLNPGEEGLNLPDVKFIIEFI